MKAQGPSPPSWDNVPTLTKFLFEGFLCCCLANISLIIIPTLVYATNSSQVNLGKPSKNKFGESWDIVPTGRGGTLSLHVSAPTEKITCTEQHKTYNKVINKNDYLICVPALAGRDPGEFGLPLAF